MNHIEETKLEFERQDRLKVIKDEFANVVKQYNQYLIDIYPDKEYQIYHAIRRKKKCKIATLNLIKDFFDFYYRADIANGSRKYYYVEARTIASWCMFNLTRVILREIANVLGYRDDHTAIIFNKKKFVDLYYIDQDFRNRVLLILGKMEDFKIDTEPLHEVLSTYEVA